MKPIFILLCSVLLIAKTHAQYSLGSTFDSGLEGWSSPTASVSYISSGGNPGGFVSITDIISGDGMSLFAPSGFLGNQSGFLGGTISFDVKNLNGAAANNSSGTPFGKVIISGSSGTASKELAGLGFPPPDGLWHTYSASLIPADWNGNLVNALGNVTQIRIVMESNNAILESNGFDNFQLQAVPEPGSGLIVLLSVCVIAFKRNFPASTDNDADCARC